MLSTKGDLQSFGVQVNAFTRIKCHRRRVHFFQTLDRRAAAGICVFQIGIGLGNELFIGDVPQIKRVCAIIEIHPSPTQHTFAIDQQIDNGRTVRHLAAVKRPLIAFQKHRRQCRIDIPEIFPQKIIFPAVFVHRDKTRQHLHIGAGHIPARRDRGKSILPLRAVLHCRTRRQRQACRAVVAGGIDAVSIDPRRSARRQHHMRAAKDDKVPTFSLQTDQSANAVIVPQNFHRRQPVVHRDAARIRMVLQRFGHEL